VYYGGVQPEIRKAVWPFLLGHYHFGMTEAERKEVSHREQPPGSLGALTPCWSQVGEMWGHRNLEGSVDTAQDLWNRI
jgi:hypothetical protein